MATKQRRSAKSTSKRKRASTAPARSTKTMDAIELLKGDHVEVKDLFDRFEKLGEDGPRDEKEDIVREACAKLTVHSTIEEEIFYPAVRELPEAAGLLNEAEVEHGTAKDLIAKLDAIQPDDAMFDANFTVLSEYVRHHVKEEEGELFPKVRKSDLDMDLLGQQLAERKEGLMAELESA